MIKSYELAKQMAGVACMALQGMLPRVRSVAFIDQSVIRDDASDTVKFLASGYLPSGKQYDVPLELSMQPLLHMREQHWLDSNELHEELEKVARAFNVAIALDGERGERIPPPHAKNPIRIAGRSTNREAVYVTLRAWLPPDTKRLVTRLRDRDHLVNALHYSTDTSSHALELGGNIDYEIGPLLCDKEFELESLEAHVATGGRSSARFQGIRFRT